MKRRQKGMSLIELMIALLIGVVIIFGATTVYNRSRKAYGDNEDVAHLQETARFAMSVIEPDIRMSNYFGLVKGASVVGGLSGQGAADPVPPGAPTNICGKNFAIDLNTNLQGDNNQYVISATKAAGCDSLTSLDTGAVWTTNAQATSDTLTVRRASVFPQPVAQPGVLQICTSRVAGRVFTGVGPCAAAPAGQLSNVIVNTYYIDRRSVQSATLPSLHRKVLTTTGGAVAFADQEVIAGVEDLQVQFGIDPSGVNGTATRYVNPNVALPAGTQVVAVRIWLLVRAEFGEVGFTDARVYQYADRLAATGVTGDLNGAGAGFAYRPSANADASMTGPQHVRRLLISRTIQLRNALGT
jgi:type IV pilus assembly protein PilW